MVGISSRTVNRSNKDRAQDRVQTWCIFSDVVVVGQAVVVGRLTVVGHRRLTIYELFPLSVPSRALVLYRINASEWSIIGTESMASQKRRLWKHHQRQRSIILFLSSFHGIIGMCNIEASHQSLISAQTSLQIFSLHNCKNVISSEYFAV